VIQAPAAARLVPALFLLSLGCRLASPVGFEVEAILRDGGSLTGATHTDAIALTIIVEGGETVELEIPRPESWSSLALAAEVEWMADRGVYRIRTPSLTAEAQEIRSPLAFRTSAGDAVELSWSEVKKARFQH
jgi:hypothetical protein